MLHEDLIKVENQLARKMLEECISNQTIKQTVKDISTVLISQVLQPLRDKIITTDHFSDLPIEYQQAIRHLAVVHSAENRQYGALMPQVPSSNDIIGSITRIKEFIDAQEAKLREVDAVKSINDMAVIMKIIIELGYTYYESPQIYTHSPTFKRIKNLVIPDREESEIRLTRIELGEPPQYALTLGIGTTETDLGPQSRGEGRIAGKSIFGLVSMKVRLANVCSGYDETQSSKYAEQMAYYKIPLTKTERLPLEVYAQKWLTWFEKLVKDPKTQTVPPLIASVSGSSGRLLVSLQALGALNKTDDSFDFDKAQIVANCIMAFVVHAGHHSTTEVAEVYNRLLDYIALDYLEKSGPSPDIREDKMPYYRIGNYNTFFHKHYADKITQVDSVELKPHFNPC